MLYTYMFVVVIFYKEVNKEASITKKLQRHQKFAVFKSVG